MKTILAVIIGIWAFAANVEAANIPITILGATETQLTIQYKATTSGSCTITATDLNGGPTVQDLNATPFTNANLDLSRTVANGYKWPTITNGLIRTVVIGTHNQIKKGTDGKSYSTQLQANSNHSITVACNSGADTGTVNAQTANVPYGSYYPELPIPDSTQVTFGMQPTVTWTDRSVAYPDLYTGILHRRVSGSADSFDDTNPAAMVFATPVIDVNGGVWTNPANLITNQVPGTLATTSTVNAPLFAPFDPSFKPPLTEYWTDFQVIAYGNASSSSVVSTWCPSKDTGQTCAVATPKNVTMATGVQAYTAVPGIWSGTTLPGSYFSSWGGLTDWFGVDDLQNRTVTGASCTGTPTVCTINGAGVIGFNVSRVAGSGFRISGCGVGADTTFTVATMDSWQQITTQQSGGGTWTNCTYRDMSVGIRVTLNNSGTLNVSLTGNGAQTRGAYAGVNGVRWSGGLSKVSDIATGCDGTTYSPAISGYLVGLAYQGIFVIQDDGQICLQSNMYNHTYNVHAQIPTNSGIIPFLDGRCFTLPDFQNPQHIWKACHQANNYTAISVNFASLNTVDNFVWTDLGTTASGIGAQVISAGGVCATALSSGLWPTLALDVLGDDGAGNGIYQYRTTASNSQDAETILVWADKTNTLISCQPLWGTYPVPWAAAHFSGQQAANYSVYQAEAENFQLSPIWFDTNRLLGGPFVARSSEGLYKNGVLTTYSSAIPTCTKANPMVCTFANTLLDNITSVNSNMGAWVNIAGATGTGWTTINGLKYAHKISNGNTASIYNDPVGASPVDSTGFGTLGGSITATMLPPVYSAPIGSVINNGGAARMVLNPSAGNGGYQNYFGTGVILQDGDPITITPTYFNSTTQYYAKVTGAPVGDFDVFKDAALTIPATYGSPDNLSGAAGWFASLAERCPDPATLLLPGPMYMDTGIGTSGAGNQKIRCLTIRVHDDGCSDFPATGEHGTYPCATDPSNVNRSSLHAWSPGDAIGDVTHYTGNHEIGYVLKVNRVSTNQVDLTWARAYGDDPAYNWRGYTNSNPGDEYAQQHTPGWTPWAESPIPGGYIKTVNPPTFAIPPVNNAHSDFVGGATAGNLTRASAWVSNAPDSQVNASIATITGPAGFTHRNTPFWSVLDDSSTLHTIHQSYPSDRSIYGQAPTSENSLVFGWNGDWMAINPDGGNTQNNIDGIGLTRTFTNIRGGTYDPGNTTTIVFLIQASSAINIKISPVLVTNWPSGYLSDISGPASLITDANSGSYCVVFSAGECRPSSTPSQVFVALRRYNDANGQCMSNNATIGFPCAFGLWAGAGWATEVRNLPLDILNRGVRRLSLGWSLPLNHYSFSNWISTPDGKWGLYADNPIQQRPQAGTAAGTQWFAMKLPPSPGPDTVNRTTYVPHLVHLNGTSGDSVRINFSYAENGDPANGWCTTRQERCYTSATPTPTNPFLFASETQSYTTCSSGCDIPIPAIPGRIVYYQVHRKNGATEVVDPYLRQISAP